MEKKKVAQDMLHNLEKEEISKYSKSLLENSLKKTKMDSGVTNHLNKGKRIIFDYCENDEGNGCIGCFGDGRGNCNAVMKYI